MYRLGWDFFSARGGNRDCICARPKKAVRRYRNKLAIDAQTAETSIRAVRILAVREFCVTRSEIEVLRLHVLNERIAFFISAFRQFEAIVNTP